MEQSRISPWVWVAAIGGGVGLLWLVSKASATATGKETGDPIPPELINPPPPSAPAAPEPTPSQSRALTIQERTGPMVAILNIKVSGMEKAFSKESTILADARKAAFKIGELVATNCPGAPKLQGTPAIKLKDVDGGYEVTIVWQAIWGGAFKGNVRDVVLNCIIAQMKASSSDFKKRFVSLRVYRA